MRLSRLKNICATLWGKSMLPVLSRGRCCFSVVFYSKLSFSVPLCLAGLSLYNKAINLKFIPIPTFDFISIHLIHVYISQAMNAKKCSYSLLVAYILCYIHSVLRIIKIISKKTLFETVQSWSLKAPERVNSVKRLSKTLREFFNGVTLLIILNKTAKSTIGYLSVEKIFVNWVTLTR